MIKRTEKGVTTVTHEGAVLRKSETSFNDGYDASYYAEVWDEASQSVKNVYYGSTMDGRDCGGSAEIDATNEVRLKAAAFFFPSILNRITAQAEYDAVRPTKGDEVVVARGRKVKKGTTGIIFWLQDGNFGMRCGIRDEKGEAHWTAFSNVDLIEPKDIDRSQLARYAAAVSLTAAGIRTYSAEQAEYVLNHSRKEAA